MKTTKTEKDSLTVQELKDKREKISNELHLPALHLTIHVIAAMVLWLSSPAILVH